MEELWLIFCKCNSQISLMKFDDLNLSTKDDVHRNESTNCLAKYSDLALATSLICLIFNSGAVLCSQCKGNGVNSVDYFNGEFKAGASCWLCGY